MYLRLLQFPDVKEWPILLTQLSAELPAEHRLSVPFLRSARRASSAHIRLVTTPAGGYSVSNAKVSVTLSITWKAEA